jgi:predicted RNase H-like HicB family nuclease
MQYSINLKIEKFNEKGEDYFVATSREVSGLVAEADTIEEVLEIAADLVPMFIELEEGGKQAGLTSVTIPKEFEYLYRCGYYSSTRLLFRAITI